MSTSVYVLYRNTSNNFNHIMTQFKNQNYVNKYLVVFDSINSERPQELSNVIYVNPQADMKMEISNTETQMKGVTQTRKDLVDLLDKKVRYKVELEKSVEKLKSKRTLDMDTDLPKTDITKTQKELDKQSAAYDILIKEITECTSKKEGLDSQINILQKIIVELQKKLSGPNDPYTINQCKDIAVSTYNAEVCIFMYDDVFYDSTYVDKVLDHLSSTDSQMAWCETIILYDHKYGRLTNRTCSTLNNMENNPTLSCLKSCGKITTDVVLSKLIPGKISLVRLTDQTKDVVDSYKKINIQYTNKKRSILKHFGVM